MCRHPSKETKIIRISIQSLLVMLLFVYPLNSKAQVTNNTVIHQDTNLSQAPITSSDIDIPILAYHKIEQEALTHWYVSTDQLNRQMDVLQAYGYNPITLYDFVAYQQGLDIPPEKPIIITFDDGTVGQYLYAAPILQSKGINATFFIPTGFIGETADERFDTSWQSNSEPLSFHMIWPEIIELYNHGFHIEAHSVNHPNLISLPLVTAENEITQSRVDIQSHIPTNPVDFFAYPYGLDNEAIQNMVAVNGFQAALDFDPDDGIANPTTSDLWELPRRGIYKDVTLDLDPQDPWWFFMRRVDPSFPIPNISLYNYLPYDDIGAVRHRFYQGEPITLTVRTSNWLSPVNVVGALSLENQFGKVYDSHLQNPAADVQIFPHIAGSGTGVFTYSWRLPEAISPGVYSYTLNIKDEHYLLGYFNSGIQTAFSVEQSPVTLESYPEEIHLSNLEEHEIYFYVDYSGSDAGKMYLTVSMSPGISVVETNPINNWTIYPPGSWIAAKDCDTPCIQTSELIYELYDANYIGGTKAYSMTIQTTPEATGDQWIYYRLAMEVPDQITFDPYLRVPLWGETDQQAYYVRVLPIDLLENQIYLPFITR